MHSCATRPCAPGVEHREVLAEAARDVVRRQDRRARRRSQPVAAHHPDVGPGDRQDRRRAPRCAPRWRRRRSPGRPPAGAGGSAGTARGARGPRSVRHPGPPPPCGMQKVLCRFRCDTSAPNSPGTGQADHRVEVRAVDVDLPAGVVHERAHLADVLLEHPVRGRVGHHDRGEVVGMCARSSPSGRPGRSRPARRWSSPRRRAGPPSPPTRHWCRARTPGSGTRRGARRRSPGGSCGSRAARRTRPASRRWAAATPRRSR